MKKFRTLFTLILALFLLAAAGCGGGKETKKEEGRVLNIFSWADNFNPEVIKEFEKKYDCKVNYDVFANNEELLAKLQAGGAQYDVIQPSDYWAFWKNSTRVRCPIRNSSWISSKRIPLTPMVNIPSSTPGV